MRLFHILTSGLLRVSPSQRRPHAHWHPVCGSLWKLFSFSYFTEAAPFTSCHLGLMSGGLNHRATGTLGPPQTRQSGSPVPSQGAVSMAHKSAEDTRLFTMFLSLWRKTLGVRHWCAACGRRGCQEPIAHDQFRVQQGRSYQKSQPQGSGFPFSYFPSVKLLQHFNPVFYFCKIKTKQ